MNTEEAIAYLESQISDPKVGLPLGIFGFVTRVTPMVNVDLLIKDEYGRTLLSWRNDDFSGTGWHIPGGIVHYKEKLEDRIAEVAKHEIGTNVQFDKTPIAVNQIFVPHKTRGHFLSLLYRCFTHGNFRPSNCGLTETDPGYLKWHDFCPNNLIEVHEIYRKHL